MPLNESVGPTLSTTTGLLFVTHSAIITRSLAHSLTCSLGHWGKGLLGNNVRVAQVSVRAVEYTDVLMLSKKQYRELKGELHPKDFEV